MVTKLMLNGQALKDGASGIRTYVARLVAALGEEIEFEVMVLQNGRPVPLHQLIDNATSTHAASSNVRPFYQMLKKNVPVVVKNAVYQSRSSWSRRPLRGWLYHEPNHIMMAHKGKSIVTVHDLSTLRFPEFHPPERVALFQKHLQRSIERAQHVITVSNTIKQEIIERFELPDNQVTAIHLGVQLPVVEDQLNSELELPDQYLLVVGAIEPRKNIQFLLDAYSALPVESREQLRIVHAGPKGWLNGSINSKIETLIQKGEWLEMGIVSPAVLDHLYHRAWCLAFPSVYEGFGLPLIEAMARGCAVLASEIPVHREVCADGATFFDLTDSEDLTNKIQRLLEDDQSHFELRTRGQQHSCNFDWRTTCSKTFDIYRDVYFS